MRQSKKCSPQTDAIASGERFPEYLDQLAESIGHTKRESCMRAYCTGLLLEADRKSIEPIAARLAPTASSVSATHQALQHFIANAPWNDATFLQAVRNYALPAMTREKPIAVWIIDDTGIPKQGKHSVGVAHQYCGQLGKQSRCQVAVMLSIANENASLSIAYNLYLPREWSNDPERMKRAGVPEDIAFETKPMIALQQLRRAVSAPDIPRGTVIADAAYGNDSGFRDQVTALGLNYAMAVQGTTTVWAPGTKPLPPKPWNGKRRKPTILQRNEEHHPISVKELAHSLAETAYAILSWREGTEVAPVWWNRSMA